MSITKKIIAIVTALTVTVWVAGPAVAQAQTAEELQAQIAALQEQLNQLLQQLAQLQGQETTGGLPLTETSARECQEMM